MTNNCKIAYTAVTLCLLSVTQSHGQTFLNSFGGAGSAVGQFSFPTGLAYDSTNGLLYVADSGNGRVEVFDSKGNSGTLGFGLSSPQSVSTDAAGDVFVADQANGRIVEFASIVQDGGLIQSFGSSGTGPGQLNLPIGVGVDTSPGGGEIVADTHNNRLNIYSSGGAFVRSESSAGSGDGQVSLPHGLAVVPGGDVYVADYGNNRIEEFSNIGNFVRTFGNLGLNAPTAVALNSANSLLYVADQNNNRIAVFTTGGNLVTSFGSAGSGSGQMSGPDGVTVTPSGMVYVADTSNNRIERWFDPASWSSGTNLFTNAATGPTSVAAGPNQVLGTSLTLNASKGLAVADTITVNAGGTITLSGGGLSSNTLNVVGGQLLDTSGTLTAGALNVSAGGTFDASHGGTFSFPSQVSVSDTGSMIKFDGGAQATALIAYTQSGGLLQIGNATFTANAPQIDGPAMYNSAGAEIRFTDAAHAMLSATSVSNFGLIDGSGNIAGPFNNFGGTVQAASGQSLNVTSNATNGGILSLASGGTLNFQSNLTLESGSAVQFALAGSTLGTQYGQLDVTSALTATGSLTVTFAGSYDPHNGEQFHVLKFGSESGTFSSVTLPTLDPGLHWDTSLLYTQGIVRVSIPGDVTGDGVTNGLDINLIANQWLHRGSPATLPGDANGDGTVNGLDINVIASHWLQTYATGGGSAANVPEPSTLILAALGTLASLAYRRRR